MQIPSLILPTVWLTGAETETIGDLLEHTSLEVDTTRLQEKIVYILATEIVAAGVPGNLWYWVEQSPYLSTSTSAYWTAIGGGGGALTPVDPAIEVATGTLYTVHTMSLAWTIHSPYIRVVVRTPIAATPTTDYWMLQVLVAGKKRQI